MRNANCLIKNDTEEESEVDKPTQIAIIEEVKRICSNPKVYLGKWLATYFYIRAAEMIKLKEGEINTGNGYLYYPHPKE